MSEFSLSYIVAVVKEKLKGRLSELPKRLSGHAHWQDTFAIDLALVACSIRTGYLLDVFSPENPVALFSRLITDLRADPLTKEPFKYVFHLYEPSSEQSFFINASLLAQRIESYDTGNQRSIDPALKFRPTIFIHLASPIDIVEPPTDVQRLLTSLLSWINTQDLPLSYSLPSDTPVESAVPLAAVLLDYPIAYVPSTSHDGALSGTPLDFYECSLSFRDNGQRGKQRDQNTISRNIMKFSCPAVLAQTQSFTYPELQSQTMIQRLTDMFMERLQKTGDPTIQITSIEHSTHTLDHVAF